MPQTLETNGHDSCTTLKAFLFLRENPSEFFRRWAKGALCFFLSLSFLFVLYSTISNQPRWKCLESTTAVINSCEFLPPANSPAAAPTDGNKTKISHIVFGIGGSLKTWPNRRHYSELWWRPGETRGFVWLDEKPPEKEPWPKNSPPYRVSGETLPFEYKSSYGSVSAVRMARIVSESVTLGLKNVRWYVMGDDDTVFFTENLVSVLSKYDHEEMYYIGGVSESVEQDVMHSYGMAFGGGGFAISYRLAEVLSRVLDGCLDRYRYFYGSDQRVHACLSELGVPLTREPGFHQLDIRGDAYGLLGAHPVAPLVSLHHLDYLKPIIPSRTQLDGLGMVVRASRSDPGRTLQKSFCYDVRRKWTVSISWGYTAQIYPWILTANVLERPFQTFQTWRSFRGEPFTFNTRPWKAEVCEEPLVYFLEGVVKGRNGDTQTSHSRYVAEARKDCKRPDYQSALKVKRVNVLAPKMKPDYWSKAPRRQCCEIVGNGGKNSINVRIRKCKHGESLSLP
ncbi:uncharacterized protein LOC143878475 [Tasmannia lanceolata]|uniref:uncharacterized protein LOC143878475 n=1 Tax=Tasmannia lanceolata TaxID=3420 RepID=UPI004063CAE0